ncbi:hypothetical protein HDU87_000802 [Geranomyces variabilis]|uniref:Uncharacterized protein n=1 Tax=Geranomyces variabilis TaxID=109894 RepID=A0AAD5TT80_9FUNG|nr:hypothetical protein HDU87_000802 [Geranomyces variabilis]
MTGPNSLYSSPPALPQHRTYVAGTTSNASSRPHNNIVAAICESSVAAAPDPSNDDEKVSNPTAQNDDNSDVMVPRPKEVLGDYFDDLPDMSEPNSLYNSEPSSPQHRTSVTHTSTDSTIPIHVDLATAACNTSTATAPDPLTRDVEPPNLTANDDSSAFVEPSEEVLGDYFDDLPDMSEPNPLYSSAPASPRHLASVTSASADASGRMQEVARAGAEESHPSQLDGPQDLCIEPGAGDMMHAHLACDVPAFSSSTLRNATLSEPFYTIPPPIPRPPQHHYTWYDASDNRWTPPVPSWAEIPKSRPRGRGRAERQAKARAAYHDTPGDGAARAAQEVAAAEAAVHQLRRDLKMLKNRRTKQLQLHSAAVCVPVESASRSSES